MDAKRIEAYHLHRRHARRHSWLRDFRAKLIKVMAQRAVTARADSV